MQDTLVRVDNGQPFVDKATLVNNADGSVSFQLPDGTFAGQEPKQYGVRHDGPEKQQYQRFTLDGQTVTSQTRPEDPVFVYLYGSGQVYPA